MDTKGEPKLKPEDVLVVNKFLREDLLGLSLDQEIVFLINLLPSTTLISKALYRMAPAELKIQLQELA